MTLEQPDVRHRESPYKRVYPSGRVRWVARYTGADGRRVTAGTFPLKRDAQAAIDRAHDQERSSDR